MWDVAGLKIDLDASAFEKGTRQARDFQDAVDDVDKATTRLARVAGAALGALVAAFSVRALARYADAWSDMQSRVGAAVKNMESAPALMQRMVQIANASYSPLNQTVEIYARNVTVLQELGYTAQQAADYTESLNHMLVITATKGERAASVQGALSKAMAIGKLQAEGLESVIANGGRVAEALAEELGTTTNGLRKMASEGKITSQVISGALLGSLEEVRKEAGKMPATIADGFVRIQTGIQAFVGRLDQAMQSSGSFAKLLVSIGDGMLAIAMIDFGAVLNSITDGVVLLGQALLVLAATRIPALIASLVATDFSLGLLTLQFTAGAASSRLMTVAMTAQAAAARGLGAALAFVGGPIGLLAGGLALLAINAMRARANMQALKEMTDQLRLASQSYADAMREFYRTLSAESYQAALSASENFISALESSIGAAKASLSDASFWTNFFGVSLYETETMASLRASIEGMEQTLASARDRQAELRDRAQEFAGAAATAGDSVSRANDLLGDFILQQMQSNELQTAALRFGQGSVEYLAVRQRQEEATLALKLRQAVAEAENVELAREMAAEALRIFQRNQQIEMTILRLTTQFGMTAEAARGVAGAVVTIKNAIEATLGPASRLGSLLAAVGEAAANTQLGRVGGGLLDRAGSALSGAGSWLKGIYDKAYNLATTPEDISDGGVGVGSGLKQIIDDVDTLTEKMTPLQTATQGWLDTFKSGIVDAIVEGKSLIGVLANIAKSIAKALAEAALFGTGPLGGKGGGLLGGLLNKLLGPIAKSAYGNVFNQGALVPFANGGIVTRPTIFPMARGVGLMGEAGPEAIMPLKRGRDGRLGVVASEKSRKPVALTVNVNVAGANGDRHIIELVDQGVTAGLRAYDRSMLPGRVHEVINSPRRR